MSLDETLPARLREHETFLPISAEGEKAPERYYGGDQAWFGTKVGRLSGCGAVAAADMFAYLALRDPKMAALYGGTGKPSVREFLRHMDAVIEYVRPSSIPYTDIPYGGLTSIPRFARNCREFAQNRSLGITVQYHTNRETGKDEAVRLTAAQLRADNPVAMLNMQNKSLMHVKHKDALGNPAESDLRFHWVVLTALEMHEGRVVATASSEGCKVEFDFEDAWTCGSRSVFGWRGIVYFV